MHLIASDAYYRCPAHTNVFPFAFNFDSLFFLLSFIFMVLKRFRTSCTLQRARARRYLPLGLLLFPTMHDGSSGMIIFANCFSNKTSADDKWMLSCVLFVCLFVCFELVFFVFYFLFCTYLFAGSTESAESKSQLARISNDFTSGRKGERRTDMEK